MRGRGGSGGQGELYAVKLGGSILTDKRRPFSLRLGVVERLADELSGAADRVVGLVLGGGSYGHYVAHEALSLSAQPREAISMITMSMLELAMAVSDVLQSRGLWPVLYPPHSFCKPSGVRPGCSWELAAPLLDAGALPVTYGDAVPCSGGGACIVSGDELLLEMACSLGAGTAVYVTDVDGLMHGGRVLGEVTLDELETLAAASGGRREGYDVTGGLARKLLVLRENRCPGLRSVWIINGLRPGRLERLLATGSAPGTRILLG